MSWSIKLKKQTFSIELNGWGLFANKNWSNIGGKVLGVRNYFTYCYHGSHGWNFYESESGN